MRQIFFLVLLLTAVLNAKAQNAVVDESSIDVECFSPTQAIIHFREVTTILNEHGAGLAVFVCSCSKNNKLTGFKGQAADATGRVLRKFKESELKQTEYSQYLAIDDYKMYLDYTPPVYPVTITYEWTMESHDDLIEFPRFCPQTSYDVSVKKAVYRLTAPKGFAIRHALLNIDEKVKTSDDGKTITLELDNLPALKKEPYARPLQERLPMAYFAPTDFIYYGTKGSLSSWDDYGKWEYSLINGSETLPEDIRKEIHQMTDGLKTDREKVEVLYHHLEKTTRYVAILLGIGGQKPAPAAQVCKSGFGDCKGLSNYMRAMLKEVGIPSNYVTISTTNRRLLKDFASVGQMNHVILQVPLPGDTLWLECTNPQLPLGYVHEDIAGHDAIEVGEHGGRMVRLPIYADSTNVMKSVLHISLTPEGAADLTIAQEYSNFQYENSIPMKKMDDKECRQMLQRLIHTPQPTFSKIDIREENARMLLDASLRSGNYATPSGQRLFVPLCPIHQGYAIPKTSEARQEDIWLKAGYLDEDEITITIPEGYAVEAGPKDVRIEQPFGSFSSSIKIDGKTIRVCNRMLRRSGRFDKALFPQFSDFFRSVSSAYNQKIVLKKE